MENSSEIVVSVVIVHYKVLAALRQALHSLGHSDAAEVTEIIVVDNASQDGSGAAIAREFPEVKWIQLKQNIGFGKACNIGAKSAAGKYLLLLNPDTIVSHDAISLAVAFMREHAEVGVIGPKLLNADGTMQPGCRRGFPTPWAAFCHFSGLSRLFTKSRRFGHYHQTWLDPDESSAVDAVSGSFMFMTRRLFSELGGFDERFFMYGEDLDLCWRVKERGFQVWYVPSMQAIHLKGKSSARRFFRSRIAFYEAMVLFSRKHRGEGAFFPGWLIYMGIILQATLNIGSRVVRSLTASLIDLVLVNATLWAALTLRYAQRSDSPYEAGLPMAGVHLLLSVSFLFMFAYNGVYGRHRSSPKTVLLAGFLATVIFMACVYFIHSIAFSRLAFAGAAGVSLALLVGWRTAIPAMLHQVRRNIYPPQRVIVVGCGPVAVRVIKEAERQSMAITGIIDDSGELEDGQFEGYQVLGGLEGISGILRSVGADLLLIATPQPWYSHVIEALSATGAKNLTIRWVPRELFDLSKEELPEEITLQDFSV